MNSVHSRPCTLTLLLVIIINNSLALECGGCPELLIIDLNHLHFLHMIQGIPLSSYFHTLWWLLRSRIDMPYCVCWAAKRSDRMAWRPSPRLPSSLQLINRISPII